MKNKYLNGFLSIIIIIFLLAVISIFSLNIVTQKFKIGSAYDFVKQACMQSEELQPSSFGHQIGSAINDSIYGGEVIRVDSSSSQENGQNYVNVGPGIFLFPGKYILTYDISLANMASGEDFAVIDVFRVSTGPQTEKTLSSSDFLNQGFKKESLEFEVGGGRGYEFRVLYLGKGDLKVGKATLVNIDKNYSSFLKKIIKRVINF